MSVEARTLLERAREVEQIAAALESARAGTGVLVLVEGPAGIGKTELLLAATRQARAAGMAVAGARGSELERQLAFGVVRQLLEPLVATAGHASRTELFAGAAALAQPLFAPASPADVEPGPAPDQAFALMHGLHWLCASLAQERAVLLTVDDAHWSDLASLRFLAYLAARVEALPLALVITARPAETDEEQLLVSLATHPRAVTVAPAGLSRDAVASLLRDEFGDAPDPSFVEACHAATGGTPFLVHELIREVRARRLAPVAAAAAQVDDIGPRTVGRSMIARVRRLGPEALALARAAAVLGADAELRRTARLAAVGDAAPEALLDALAAAGVLDRGRPIEFVHPIVRTAVYNEIPPGERGSLHARAVQLLAEDGIAEERIAGHLLATVPSGDEHAVGVLLRTARTALARGAPRSAASYLERALGEPPVGDALAGVLHLLGVAEVHAGRSAAAADHLREAHRLAGTQAQRIAIAQDLAGCLRLLWSYREAARVVGQALDESGDPDGELALGLEAELLLMAALEPSLHPQVEARLERRAPDTTADSPATGKYLAAVVSDATLRLLRPAREIHELGAQVRAAGILEDLAHGGSFWINVVAPLIIADGFALAEQMLVEALDEARRRASAVFSTRAYVARSMLGLRQGALREALADAATAVEAGREAGFYFSTLSLSVLIDALLEHGDPAAAQEALDERDGDDDLPDTFLHNWVLHSRARLRLAQGRRAAAITDFEELGRRLAARGQPNPGAIPHRSSLALALLGEGDGERAALLAEEEVDLARRWGAPRAVGIAVRTLGLCRGGAEGTALLRESAATLAESGARLEHARSLVDLGAALRRAGERAGARDQLHAGMELAHGCGALPLVEHAREELVASGARPRRIMRSGVDALTPSELRVARMAAEGMTNREIAQALFVTARTVETHLTQAFRKLDIGARGELGHQLDRKAGD